MTPILISIKEKWARLIFSGRKTVELRKNRPACYDFPFENECKCFICHSGKIHGFFIVKRIDSLTLTPQEREHEKAIIASYQKQACVTPEHWDKYSPKYAWHIAEVHEFAAPISLANIGIKRAPQSWQYLEPEQVSDKLSA